MPEQERQQPSGDPLEVTIKVCAGSSEVPHRLDLPRGDVDRGEEPGPVQQRQLGGIALVGLDPIA
jgi:hypothetical protein